MDTRQRLRALREEHQRQPGDGGVERLRLEIEVARIQYAGCHVPKSRMRGRLGRQCQHLRGNVGGQDRTARPNASGRRQGLLPGASSYVEHPIGGANPGQIQHPLG
jgi:hypothetical protein